MRRRKRRRKRRRGRRNERERERSMQIRRVLYFRNHAQVCIRYFAVFLPEHINHSYLPPNAMTLMVLLDPTTGAAVKLNS